MSNAKHTPGPWIFEPDGMFGADPEFEGYGPFPFGYLSTAKPLSPIFTLAPILHFDESELEANAHLMAAAPDMLEALKAISKEARKNKPNPDLIFALAGAAIAKAEGRTDA